MTRLNLIVEGQSEESFANAVLMNHLADNNVFLSVQQVLTGRGQQSHIKYKGGLGRAKGQGWPRLRNHLSNWIKQQVRQPDTYFSSFIDFYALPADFPGYDDAQKLRDPYQKVAQLEKRFGEEIGSPRFVPYIQLHEFEALILCDVDKLQTLFLDDQDGIAAIKAEVEKFSSPELINEGNETAPSKRLAKHIPSYWKTKTACAKIVSPTIGLQVMRSQCPHFHQWVAKLETLRTG